jgi:DNA-binding transcriptional regulator YiaG
MGATVLNMATVAATSVGTIALADQLNRVRERVPLTVSDVASATGANDATVRQWFERKSAPMGTASPN